MGWTGSAAAALAAALLAFAGDSLAAGDDAKPFPGDRSQTLKSGSTYYVDGRVRIGKGVDILVPKDTRVVGRGEKGGIIELEGQMEMVGVSGLEVSVKDVTIELQPKFDELRISVAEFGGTSAGVVTPKDVAVDGRVFIESATFGGKSTVDVVMSANNIDLQRVNTPNHVHVRAVEASGTAVNKVRLMVMNCCGGSGTSVAGALNGGLVVERVHDVTVRTNVLGGDKVTFLDCANVTFDANYVRCKTLEFVQTTAGHFTGTTVSKCDMQCEKIVVSAPYVEGKGESLVLFKCWFNGETKDKAILDKFVTDRADDPKCGVTVGLEKISDKPLQFAGTVKKP